MLKVIENIILFVMLTAIKSKCDTFNIIVKSSAEMEKLTHLISKAKPSKSISLNTRVINEIPTIRDAPAFNATADAIILRKATQGVGTDEDAIIKILTKRSNRQRQFIAQAFRHQYDSGLVKKLLDETSGQFQDIIFALMIPRTDFQAKRLYLDGDSDPKLLIDILCTTKTNEEMKDLTDTYKRISKKSLESLLARSKAGILRKLLINLSHADRDENQGVKRNVAVNDSQALFQADEQKMETDASVFIKIFTKRSFQQISLTIKSYEEFTNHKLENAIMKKFSGDTERAFLALIQSARNNTASYFAERLHESIFPEPIHDDLIFIIVTRSEKDLGNIKAEYGKKYKRSLTKDINEKVVADIDYKHTLLALIG